MFRRKKKQSLPRRIVRTIRECYLYCKVYLAEKVATHLGYKAKALGKQQRGLDKHFYSNLRERFACWVVSRKYFFQAAVCRYARRTGTYKNL